MNPLMKMFVMLRTSEPQSAGQKPTTKPSTSRPTIRNRKALITTIPSPIVTRMNGNVNSTRTGLRIALKKLRSTTASEERAGVAAMDPGHDMGRDHDPEGQDQPSHEELAKR